MLVLLGDAAVEFVLGFSALLREDHVPGVVSGGLVGLLLLAGGAFSWETYSRLRALAGLRNILGAREGTEFHDDFSEVTREVNEFAEGRGVPTRSVEVAWKEYRETLIEDDGGGRKVLHNSVRPSQFFNLDDLHFGPGFWRVVPGLFVTSGLFLTFLGLVSALDSMQDEGGASEEAMTNLLAVASAKFIMSLTGLACSILFTVVLRRGMDLIERAIGSLNRTLEERLSFLSLESLALQQRDAIIDQREHFRRIGLELVEELGRPLREDLPRTISESIGNAVSPLIAQVGELGTASVGDMVKDLSSRISTDVEGALTRAGEQLAAAADRLDELVGRMDASSGRMGSEFEGVSERLTEAVDQLRATLATGATETSGALSEGVESILAAMRQSLEGIRDNTAEGAREMAEGAAQMRAAAEGLRRELEEAAQQGAAAAQGRMDQVSSQVMQSIGGAGEEVRAAIEETGRGLTAIAAEATARTSREVLDPIGEIAKQLETTAELLDRGAQQIRRASDGVKDGADASSRASAGFQDAARALVAASDAVQPSVVRLEAATQSLAGSTRDVAVSTRNNTTSAGQVLKAAEEALGGQRRAIEETLSLLGQSLERMRGQGERLDLMDEKLGAAFNEYQQQVEGAVGKLRGHVTEMQGHLNPALDKMREIVEQAEAFTPQSGRR